MEKKEETRVKERKKKDVKGIEEIIIQRTGLKYNDDDF